MSLLRQLLHQSILIAKVLVLIRYNNEKRSDTRLLDCQMKFLVVNRRLGHYDSVSTESFRANFSEHIRCNFRDFVLLSVSNLGKIDCAFAISRTLLGIDRTSHVSEQSVRYFTGAIEMISAFLLKSAAAKGSLPFTRSIRMHIPTNFLSESLAPSAMR